MKKGKDLLFNISLHIKCLETSVCLMNGRLLLRIQLALHSAPGFHTDFP